MLERFSTRPGIRSVAALLTTALVVVLVFGLLFIQTSADLFVRRQQADFGEVARMSSLFRDVGDMVMKRNTKEARANPVTDLPNQRFLVETASGDKPKDLSGGMPNDVNSGKQPQWCAELPVTAARLQLSVSGFQARDRNPVMSAVDVAEGTKLCARASAQPILQGPSELARSRDLAITDSDGKVLLVLRGDWPAQLSPPRPKPGSADGADKAANGLLPARSGGDTTPRIEIGGQERLVYQWPLDLGRPFTIIAEDGAGPDRLVTCAPRQCQLSALGDPPSTAAVLNNLSPFTKAAFGLAVVVVLLLIPLIKLASIDHNASLGWMDVIGVIAAVPLMASALVTACAVIFAWTGLRRENDQLARSMAMAIARDINGEVRATIRAARSVGNGLKPPPAVAAPSTMAGPLPLPISLLQKRNQPETAVVAAIPSTDPSLPTIRQRRYYARMAAGDMIDCAASETPDCGYAYTVDEVPAAASGSSRLVILIADKKGAASASGGDFLMAGKPPAATLSVPVPQGFGFAVIDPASLEVLQHSDRQRAFSEKFDTQLDATDTLMRAAEAVALRCQSAGSDATAEQALIGPAFEARYAAHRVRMAFGAVCSARWLIATWYDSADLQGQTLEPAYVASICMFGLIGFLAILLAASMFRDPRLFLRQIWPDPKPFSQAFADGWYGKGLLARFGVAALMVAGLWLAKGDVAVVHGGLCVLLLPMLLAGNEADRNWGAISVRVGMGFALVYLAVAMVAVGWLGWETGSFGQAVAYFVLLLAAGAIATRDWLGIWPKPDQPAAPSPTTAPFEPPLVKRRRNRILWHQALAICLVAVIPALAAYSAGAGQVRQDRSITDRYLLAQSRKDALDQIARMAPLYPADRPASCTLADGETRGLLTDYLDARAGSQSGLAGGIMRLWGSERPLPVTAMVSGACASDSPPKDAAVVRVPGSRAIAVRDSLLVAAAILVAAYLIYRLLLLAGQNLFGLQHFGFRTLHPRHSPEQIREKSAGPIKTVFINYPTREFRRLQQALNAQGRLELFDLAIERDKLGDKGIALLSAKSWIVTGFESIVANRDLRLRTLALLEQLTARPEVSVYFFVQTMPLVRLRQARDREKREAEAAGETGIMNESESYRWAELFSEFITYTWTETLAEPAPPEADNDPPHGDEHLERLLLLVEEPAARANVRRWAHRNRAAAGIIATEMINVPSDRIQDQIRSFAISLAEERQTVPPGEPGVVNPLNDVYREQIYEYMANFLGDYYQGEWVRSSKEEHLILHHLAHGEFIITSNFPVLNSLLSRRLIKTEPNFRLMNDSFGHWIRTLEHPDWFHQFRADTQRAGLWTALRVPLLLLVAAGSVLVTYLDHEGSGSLLTLLPGAVATMPILLARFSRPLQANV